MKTSDTIIIGGGAAGMLAAHTLSAANPALSITLVKDEKTLVNRCSIPYGVNGEKSIENYMVPNEHITASGAELILEKVKDIDKTSRTITLESGEILGYGTLLLATGSRPRLLDIPGIKSSPVVPVRSINDLEALRAKAAPGIRALVLGGGYVGVELASELEQMGVQATLVEKDQTILQATTEPEFIQDIQRLLEQKEIRVITGQTVASFEGKTRDTATAVLEDGTRMETDLVVLAVGVEPNMELARKAGLETSPIGIVVGSDLRTSDPHIFAAGDCARKYAFSTGLSVRGDFGTNAVFMGKVAGQNMAGARACFQGTINANVSAVYGVSFGSAGLTEACARKAGINVLTGMSSVLDRYPMIDGAGPIKIKLIFDQDSKVLIGGSVMRNGDGAAPHIDQLSLAIQKKTTLEEILVHQYATHPRLAAVPSDNGLVAAAMNALTQ